MLKLTEKEKMEDEIMELGFTIREKDIDIRYLKLKLYDIKYLLSNTSDEDCKIKDQIIEIIESED